ncbi:MAG TPA: transketolase C-terminal domain-containing protein [Steroidobacteraceae bacterium]|nr:transketolase C-terminal domain-containing protein [Steroidobacteraceae bacterium]
MAEMTFAQAINDALHVALATDQDVITYGLGTGDPKEIFGTTKGLREKFGDDRVFDMPTSENAMTGIGIGAALYGLRPVLSHQRLDFALLSLDQIINNAAKWHFMFGGQRSVPITIRMIIGRGWGQGPTHSQNLQAIFAHVPGLKVVMPSSAADAKGLLLSAIFDPNPVIFLEHRWLHNLKGDVPPGDYRLPLGKCNVMAEGGDATIVASSLMTVEARHALSYLSSYGIFCDLIDLRTVSPIDWNTIRRSVSKTGRLLVVDSGTATGSIAGEIIARVSQDCWSELRAAPVRLAMPDFPEATSPALTEHYHVRAEHIAASIAKLTGHQIDCEELASQRVNPHDVPGAWFTGPF